MKLTFHKRIVILIGNIGSGKTTVADSLVKKGYVCVSPDWLRYMFSNGRYIFDKRIDGAAHYGTKKIVEVLMKKDVNIVVDEVCVTKWMRKTFIDLAKLYGYKSIAYVMPKLSKSVSVRRRMKSNHGNQSKELWESVWEKFYLAYEEPTRKEGFDRIVNIKETKNV